MSGCANVGAGSEARRGNALALVRNAVIVVISVAAVAAALVPIANGRPPGMPAFIFACFSAPWLVAGAVAWTRRPGNVTGPVLLAIGLCGALILLGAAPVPGIDVVTQAAATTATVLLFLILMISPAGRFSSRSDLAAFVGIAGTYVAVVLVREPWLDPARPWILIVICTALLVVVVNRWQRASGPSRRSLAPIAVAGAIAAAIFLTNSVSSLLELPNEPGSLVFAVDAVGRALIPFGFLLGLLRLRMARIRVADLVIELGDLPPPDRLRGALATALGDPRLQVGYWSATDARFTTAGGTPMELPGNADEGEAMTIVERDGAPVAVIVHDRALEEDPGLVASVGAALRLALENERLAERVSSQLAEVRASRARIVEAGDTERRRVERDLHDGAQQRIVALTLALRIAQNSLGPDAEPAARDHLDRALEEARAALAELRELARGIHPQILTSAGLAAAVGALAQRSSINVAVRIVPEYRYEPAIESAAYFVISEALANAAKYAAASNVTIAADWSDGELTVEIADDGVGGAAASRGSGLRGLADRLDALDGRLEIRSPVGGGTRVLARIPSSGPIPNPA